MTSLVIIWFGFGIATAGLALYRKFLSMHEQDILHLAAGEEAQIPQQVELAHKMDVIDIWGKGLTTATVALGVAVAAIYLFQAWQISNQAFH